MIIIYLSKSLTVDPLVLAKGVLSLSGIDPSLGGPWGMLSIQAQIRAWALDMQKNRQRKNKVLDISIQQRAATKKGRKII